MTRIGCLILVLLSACDISDEGRAPPGSSFFFPAGLAVDPEGTALYVTNANTDLRFNGGSLVRVDFAAVSRAFLAHECTDTDPLDARVAVCREAPFIDETRSVRIGSFGGQPVVQRFLRPRLGSGGQRLGTLRGCAPVDSVACQCDPDPDAPTATDPNCVPRFDPDPSQGFRLLIPVRGDPSLTWVNVSTDGHLDCGQDPEPVGRCDAEHRMTTLANSDPVTVLAPEPFEVSVSEDMGIAVTAHLYGAGLGLFDVGDSAAFRPSFIDQRLALFDATQNGARGAYGIAVRPIDSGVLPAVCEGYPHCTLGDFSPFFVTSRYTPRIGQIVVRGADQCRPGLRGDDCAGSPRAMSIVPSSQLRIDTFLLDGSDVRDIKFTSDGNRAFVITRRPPSVLDIDTSPTMSPSGEPMNVFRQVMEVCAEPALLALRQTPGPLRVYVTCFAAGQIFVLDPELGQTVDVIDAGRGPNALQVTTTALLGTVGLVANFADNNVAVIDLNPGSPSENRILFKIGIPHSISGPQ